MARRDLRQVSFADGLSERSRRWRFRQELAAHGLAEALFEEISQLDARGLIVRQGTLIDATLLQALAVERSHAVARHRTDGLTSSCSAAFVEVGVWSVIVGARHFRVPGSSLAQTLS